MGWIQAPRNNCTHPKNTAVASSRRVNGAVRRKETVPLHTIWRGCQFVSRDGNLPTHNATAGLSMSPSFENCSGSQPSTTRWQACQYQFTIETNHKGKISQIGSKHANASSHLLATTGFSVSLTTQHCSSQINNPDISYPSVHSLLKRMVCPSSGNTSIHDKSHTIQNRWFTHDIYLIS